MKTRILRYIIPAALLFAILLQGAQASSFVYAARTKEIKAGIIDIDANITNPVYWHAFYIMDQKADIKPSGWFFTNPLAAPGHTPDKAEYWRVGIGVSLADMSQFDVLLLPLTGQVSFTVQEREKLRKFVDGGGTLWIEGTGSGSFVQPTGDPPNKTDCFFIDNLNFGTGVSGDVKVPDAAHPVLCRPHPLNWPDASTLISSSGGKAVTGGSGVGVPDPAYFMTVVSDTASRSVLSAAQYGSGHIVVSSSPVSQNICSPVIQSGVPYLQYLPFVPSGCLALAYNIVNWGTEYTTFHKDARRSGYSFDEIGTGMLPLWDFRTAPVAQTDSSPAIIDDVVIYVDGNNVLRAFDISAQRDRDADGNPDDGVRDQSLGAPYDELWSVALGEKASSPTTAYVPYSGGIAVPVVFVVTQSGRVLGWSVNAYTTPPVTTEVIPSVGTFPGTPPAPTYIDGTLFCAGGDNLLHGYDFLSTNNPKYWTSAVLDPALALTGTISGSPVAGYVRDPVTGTVDKVVYIPRSPGGVQAYPFKSYNEVLSNDAKGITYSYQIRSGPNAILNRAGYNDWTVYSVKGTGDREALTTASVGALGQFSVAGTDGSGNSIKGSTLLADYQIDPFTSPLTPRSEIRTKGSGGVAATPALAKNDILYFGTSEGSLYAVQEIGRRTGTTYQNLLTRVKWRWSLNDAGAVTLLGGAGTPFGSPAVTEDTVYFAVNAGGAGYILAFEADPVFKLNLGVALDRSTPPTVLQFDPANATSPPQPVMGVPDESSGTENPVYSPFTVDYDSGQITFFNFRVGNDPSRDLSCSGDMQVNFTPASDTAGAGATQQQIHYAFPSSYGSGNLPFPGDNWNNLLWCVRLSSEATVSSSPAVFGRMLYAGCSDGVLYSFDTAKVGQNIQKNGGVDWSVIKDKGAGWEHEVSATALNSTIAGSSGMLMVASAEGLEVIHNPSTLVADGNRIVEVDGAGNVSWSCDGTVSYVTDDGTNWGGVSTAFDRPAVAKRAPAGGIVVADTGNNRVVWLDKSGRIIQQVTGFADAGNKLVPSAPKTLNRPMDVQMWIEVVGGRQEYHYLIADSGNWRVVEVAVKYNAATGAYDDYHLVWCTKTVEQGKKYNYTCAQRVAQDDPSNPGITKVFTMCIISNYRANPDGRPEGPGGALVRFDADGLIHPSANPNYVNQVIASLDDDTKLRSPRFFRRVYKTNSEYSDVIIDSTGIYVVKHSPTISILKYTAADYKAQTSDKPFAPSYAQFLANGNLLVTNRATGTYAGGTKVLYGEVFELDSTLTNILNTIEGGTTSHGLRQPMSAERTTY